MTNKWNQAKADELIPGYMQPGLKRWVEQGIPPGEFLCSVLQNDLKAAAFNADQNNQKLLYNYVLFLENYAPGPCWGSFRAFREWYEQHLPRDPSQTV